jgi:hypothetical protein
MDISEALLSWMAKNWQQREAICAECEYSDGMKCKKCGCYIQAKCKLKCASCPLNKWGKGTSVP